MANAEKVRRLYDRRAAQYDERENVRWQETLRSLVFGRARGEVLEVGVGTGATFAYYPRDLAGLTGLDISEEMLAKARAKAGRLPFPVHFKVADFQRLPYPAETFDTVTSSLAFCGVPDPLLLFAEIRRVLRPGGQLLAVEHIRPSNSVLGVLADIGDPLYDRLVGCHLNRRTLDLLRQAGFGVTVLGRAFMGAGVAFAAEPVVRAPSPE
jgi:ubiquinone/menaquinone biosynthesis C-methylase UbiE